MKSKMLFCLFGIICMCGHAQTTTYPVPPIEEGHLFYLQHSRNMNTVLYEVNFKNGVLNTEKPVHAFWIRYSEKGQRQELNYPQRSFAYGVHSVALPDNTYQLNFVSNKNFKVYLEPSAERKYHVITSINQKRAVLNHIYVNIIGGSALSPKVDYVEIFGTDPVTKKIVSERVKMN